MASNKEINQKAIELVLDHERKNGREPELVGNIDLGYDIVSSGRKIEVKGASHNEVFKGFVIEEKQYKNFQDTNFWIYRVLNVITDRPPVILMIRPSEINLTKPQIRYNATSWKDKGRPRQV